MAPYIPRQSTAAGRWQLTGQVRMRVPATPQAAGPAGKIFPDLKRFIPEKQQHIRLCARIHTAPDLTASRSWYIILLWVGLARGGPGAEKQRRLEALLRFTEVRPEAARRSPIDGAEIFREPGKAIP